MLVGERLEQAITLYVQGNSIKTVAGLMAVSYGTVNTALARAGKLRPWGGHTRLDPAGRKAVLERYASGDRTAQICSDANIGPSTLIKMVDRAKLPRRRPRRGMGL